ncbi:serine/threonine-protein kinase [Posidoniimonas polymericola]|nr:serine/threonine-protein kinase [Posidoniimonas polymericola]
MSIRQKKLPIASLERIDDLCADFERAWQAGEPRPIEASLPADSTTADSPADEREVLLAELIVLEVDYRRRRGEAPTAEDYLPRFPEAAAAIDDALREVLPAGEQAARAHGGAFEPPSVARVAELFPALEIVRLIGAGGMGAVYQARQPGLDRLVALKILPEEFGHDVKFALRFTREARTLAKLTHPNIVSVYEFGHAGDTYYFLMEYVDGSTLREVVRSGGLSPEHALAIVPHLCDALQYAHDKGVVHRDIKPENILISADGVVKIADFGLSRILGADAPEETLTGTHQVMGTPRYMAPEQLEGARGVDHRADIYSLGVVFYEMLTGELPIGRFAAPSQKVQIDVRLDEVVLRTLEKEPQRRYQHASQIKTDVQTIVSTRRPDPVATVDYESPAAGSPSTASPSLAEQELAGRMLLTRRRLMERIEQSLRPLFRWQLVQVLIGIAFIAIGAQCWARNTNVPHRVFNGVLLHVYGVVVISQGLLVCTRIKRIDYSKPIADIRAKLDSVRSAYLRAGVLIGFIWWLMWIPVAVSLGFDDVLHPYSLYPSLAVGVVGFAVSVWWYLRMLKSDSPNAERNRRSLAGNSIASAYLAIEEIEQARIE